jgi:phospholipid-transporting ATPase
MKNASLPPSKRSRIEHQMDAMILAMFALLFAMCLSGSVLFALWTRSLSPAMWYLAPDQAPTEFDPARPQMVGIYSFITSFVLYGYLIPISLYVSLEMVKVVQVRGGPKSSTLPLTPTSRVQDACCGGPACMRSCEAPELS